MTDGPVDAGGGHAAPGGAEPSGGREEELPSLPVRAAQVFVAPGRLFDRLRRDPAWVGMLVLLVVLSLASTYLMPEELLEQVVRGQMAAGATEADVQRALDVSRPLGYAAAVLGPPVVTAAVAGFLYFTYTLVLGGEGEFRQVFSVSVHAWLIPTVGALALLPLMVATGDAEVRLALHLAVPGLDDDTYLHSFLRRLNVFGLWAAAVLGIGASRLYERRAALGSAAFLAAAYVAVAAVLTLVLP